MQAEHVILHFHTNLGFLISFFKKTYYVYTVSKLLYTKESVIHKKQQFCVPTGEIYRVHRSIEYNAKSAPVLMIKSLKTQ